MRLAVIGDQNTLHWVGLEKPLDQLPTPDAISEEEARAVYRAIFLALASAEGKGSAESDDPDYVPGQAPLLARNQLPS